jgi:predicted DCC family thiol-disulfide oxidoreductase YuxK
MPVKSRIFRLFLSNIFSINSENINSMKNIILIYDDNCPLCVWYTGMFVKYGLLDSRQRKPFSTIDNSTIQSIDLDKAKDAIPLINTETGRVVYGIDAMITILSNKFPLVKSIGECKPVYWFLRRLYKFISYNRKIIVAQKCGSGAIDCAPSFNYYYRTLFLIVLLLLGIVILYPVHIYLSSHISAYQKTFAEIQAAYCALVALNSLMAYTLPRQRAFEYLGQVNMLAVEAICLIFLCVVFSSLLYLPEWMVIACLGIITPVIMKEYVRRMDYAGIFQQNRRIAALNLASMLWGLIYITG